MLTARGEGPAPPTTVGGVRCHRGGLTAPRSPPGLLWQLRPSDVEVELLAHTRRVVSRDLPEETGLHAGWVQNGGLFIASSQQRLLEYQRLMSVGAPGQGGGAGLPAGAGHTAQGRSPPAGRATRDRPLCLSEAAFAPLKWGRVAQCVGVATDMHGAAETGGSDRPSRAPGTGPLSGGRWGHGGGSLASQKPPLWGGR